MKLNLRLLKPSRPHKLAMLIPGYKQSWDEIFSGSSFPGMGIFHFGLDQNPRRFEIPGMGIRDLE